MLHRQAKFLRVEYPHAYFLHGNYNLENISMGVFNAPQRWLMPDCPLGHSIVGAFILAGFDPKNVTFIPLGEHIDLVPPEISVLDEKVNWACLTDAQISFAWVQPEKSGPKLIRIRMPDGISHGPI